MEAKHTPGPWWVTDYGVRDSGGKICGSVEAFRYPGQGPRYEAELLERAANMHVIAAAPDLLAELRFAVALLKPMFGCTVQVQRMETAIAKATGLDNPQ